MFSIIVAMSKNGVIGNDNSLIWNLPDDLKRFKELTIEKTIIMGRKTFESLPYVLPKRQHIILTRNEDFKFIHKDVKIFNNLEDIINTYGNSSEEIFVIGGGQIYSQFLKYTTYMYITEILNDFRGDTYFPLFSPQDWLLEYESELFTYNSLNYIYKNLSKKTLS